MRGATRFLTAALITVIGAGAARAANLGPVGEGRRVWLKLNCYSCHGDNAAGGMGPNVQGADGSDVVAAMLQGDATGGGMRSFRKFATNKDAANLKAYLASIGTPKEPTWLDWWNPTP